MQTKKHAFGLLILFLPAFIILNCSAETLYKVIGLGSNPSSVATSINNGGQIVGYSRNNAGAYRATLFDSSGNTNGIDLGTLGGTESRAMCINDFGQIVGYSQDSEGRYRATLFDPTGAGNNIDLGTIFNYSGSWAFSINNQGQIVGSVSGASVAVIFDSTGNGNNISLNEPGVAYSINDFGEAVGYGLGNDGNDTAHIFDLSGSGNHIDLGRLGSWESEARSISESGLIVGYSHYTSIITHRAVLFDPTGNGNNINLGTLGGNSSYAYCVNNFGQIVGASQIDIGLTSIFYGCLFDLTGNGNNKNLNSLIDPSSGWLLGQANSINDLGWIVGTGGKPGSGSAYLLIPVPEPSFVLSSFFLISFLIWKCRS